MEQHIRRVLQILCTLGFRCLRPGDTCTCMRRWTVLSFDQVMACHLFGAWTNAGLLSIGPMGTNVTEIVIEMQYRWCSRHVKTQGAWISLATQECSNFSKRMKIKLFITIALWLCVQKHARKADAWRLCVYACLFIQIRDDRSPLCW